MPNLRGKCHVWVEAWAKWTTVKNASRESTLVDSPVLSIFAAHDPPQLPPVFTISERIRSLSSDDPKEKWEDE